MCTGKFIKNKRECRETCIESEAEENSERAYKRAIGMIRENSTSNTYMNEKKFKKGVYNSDEYFRTNEIRR